MTYPGNPGNPGQWPPRQQPPQWPRQPDPRDGRQQWPPQQPQYPQQQPYPVQQWQQPGPQVMVTRKPITAVEHLFHFVMCFPTCGLWIPVWIARAAAGRKERTYYGPR